LCIKLLGEPRRSGGFDLDFQRKTTIIASLTPGETKMALDPQRPKRGLSALLSATTQPDSPAPGVAPVLTSSIQTADVSVNSVRPSPTQPRSEFNPQALAELAASIKAHGLIQPVVVRRLQPAEASGEVQYELIAGERRWRAAQMAGLAAVPAVIKDVFEQRDILLLSLIENLQRDDLNPIEEAVAYDRLAKTFKLTHEQIADGVGKNRASVSNQLRLLELPSSVQIALKTGRLSIGHAKVLLSIPDPNLQRQFAAKAEAEDLTVRDLERLVLSPLPSGPSLPQQTSDRRKGTRATRLAPPNIQDIERQLREYFGTKVYVEEGLRKGKITIEFYSVEDFARIVELFGVETE
jgi:ParB family chromosome partitioning protein